MPDNMGITRFPKQIRLTAQDAPSQYVRLDEVFATHELLPDILGCVRVGELETEGIQIYRGTVPDEHPINSSQNLTAVYSLSSGGAVAVPTGRLFVRFDSQYDAQDQQPDLRELGFDIERVPPYATNAAWIVSISGKREDALHDIEKVRSLSKVEHVEPQMLQPMAFKSGELT